MTDLSTETQTDIVRSVLDRQIRQPSMDFQRVKAFVTDDDVDDPQDDDAESDASDDRAPVDLAGLVAAGRLARTFAKDPELDLALMRGDHVVVRVPGELLKRVERALPICLPNAGIDFVELKRLGSSKPPTEYGSAVAVYLLSHYEHSSSSANARLEQAFGFGRSLILCAPTAEQSLVPFRALIDVDVELANLAAPDLRRIVEIACGASCDGIDDDLAREVTFGDLAATLSPAVGAERSVARLRRLIATRHVRHDGAHKLETLAGYGAAKVAGLRIAEELRLFRAGEIPWRDVSRGLLLSGPPGTGKTFFASALAASAGVDLVVGGANRWQQSRDGGQGAFLKAMRVDFDKARQCAPAILFIDEIDSFLSRSASHGHNHSYHLGIVNGLLAELDGSVDRDGVFVLGATNDIDSVDPAIYRSGRLETIVEIGPPNAGDLARILRTHLGEDCPDADLEALGSFGLGGTGADAAAWVRAARGIARSENRLIAVEDVAKAIRQARGMPVEENLERICLHEAGHAVAIRAFSDFETVDALYISAGGGAIRTSRRRSIPTRSSAIRDIVVLLAGRAAETVALGEASAGAGGPRDSDLGKATSIAMDIVRLWGLGSLGPIWLGYDLTAAKVCQSLAFREVPELIRAASAEAERIVRENEGALRQLAEALAERGFLSGAEVAAVVADVEPFEIQLENFAVEPASANRTISEI